MADKWEVLDIAPGTIVSDEYVEGVRVIVMRGPVALCAYLGIPSSHPLAGYSYDDIPLQCHGGLTFGKEGDGPFWPKEFYWYGWDYGHAGDRATYSYESPLKEKFSLRDNEKEWTVKEVKEEARWVAYDCARLMKLAENIYTKAKNKEKN